MDHSVRLSFSRLCILPTRSGLLLFKSLPSLAALGAAATASSARVLTNLLGSKTASWWLLLFLLLLFILWLIARTLLAGTLFLMSRLDD